MASAEGAAAASERRGEAGAPAARRRVSVLDPGNNFRCVAGGDSELSLKEKHSGTKNIKCVVLNGAFA